MKKVELPDAEDIVEKKTEPKKNVITGKDFEKLTKIAN